MVLANAVPVDSSAPDLADVSIRPTGSGRGSTFRQSSSGQLVSMLWTTAHSSQGECGWSDRGDGHGEVLSGQLPQ